MAAYGTRTMLNCTVEKAWELVTTLETQMDWREDLKEIEILDSRQFIEHTRDGYITHYTLVKVEERKLWQRTLTNEDMVGQTLYTFVEKGNQTLFTMKENMSTSKLLFKIFVKNYLRSHQYNYIQNLKKAIGQET